MKREISKTNADLAFFNSRLDEMRMSGHARLKAKAHLARAEAIADLIASAATAIAKLFKTSPARPNRPAASAG